MVVCFGYYFVIKKKGALEDLKALMENNRINRLSPWSKAAGISFEHNFKVIILIFIVLSIFLNG